jgi:SAM-dependent methyltransferase
MNDPYWNHNVHYHPVVLAAVPDGCRRALDVGCGDGLLARKLAQRARSVTGVDRSPEMIRLARTEPAGNVTFVAGDYLDETTLPEGAYDFVSAVAVVHHSPLEEALVRLARLVAPGGRLAVVGMARTRSPRDWLIALCAVPASLLIRRRRGGKRGPAGMPMQEADLSYAQVRAAAKHLLPGCRFRRHLLLRYSLLWDKPREGGP